MRICLATNGTLGDVFPFLAVGRELVARGHEAWIFTHPHFKGEVDTAGLGFYPLAPDIDLAAILRDPNLFHHRRGSQVVFDWIRRSLPAGIASFRQMLAEQRPDVLVSHYMMLGGREVCAHEGVPCINASLAPCAWIARDDPCPAIQQRPGRLRKLGARVVMHGARPVVRVLSDRYFAKPLREAGIRDTRDIFLGSLRGGQLNLGMWSPHFRPPCADDPPGGVITGFAAYDGDPDTPLDSDLTRFLDAGEPPIVFAMGSTAHSSAGSFYELAAGACAQLGTRGVLLTGDPARAPRDLPPTVRAFGYAPFSKLFRRAAVTVHHGGIGSVGQALAAGMPTLVVPRAHDQFNNGVHVQQLGVGRTLPFHKLSITGFVRALDDLSNNPETRERAATTGARIATERGAGVAADRIESFMQRDVDRLHTA